MKIDSEVKKNLIIALSLFMTMSSCNLNKKSTATKKQNIEGLYSTNLRPSDVGEPYRIYVKFNKNGEVISLNSALSCDSVKKIIDRSYAEKSTYKFKGKDSLKFIFVNNRVNDNKYTSINSAKILNNNSIRIVTVIQVASTKSYKISDYYILCP